MTAAPMIRGCAADTLSDERLVQRYCAGDQVAFDAIYARYHRLVASTVARIMGDTPELDDLVQEVFVEAMNGLHRVREPDRVRSWLVTIAVRKARRGIGRRQRMRMLRRLLHQVEPAVFRPMDAERVRIRRAIDELPVKLRIPFVLRCVQEESLEDTAAMCEVSLATAKRRIARAREQLQLRLGDD